LRACARVFDAKASGRLPGLEASGVVTALGALLRSTSEPPSSSPSDPRYQLGRAAALAITTNGSLEDAIDRVLRASSADSRRSLPPAPRRNTESTPLASNMARSHLAFLLMRLAYRGNLHPNDVAAWKVEPSDHSQEARLRREVAGLLGEVFDVPGAPFSHVLGYVRARLLRPNERALADARDVVQSPRWTQNERLELLAEVLFFASLSFEHSPSKADSPLVRHDPTTTAWFQTEANKVLSASKASDSAEQKRAQAAALAFLARRELLPRVGSDPAKPNQGATAMQSSPVSPAQVRPCTFVRHDHEAIAVNALASLAHLGLPADAGATCTAQIAGALRQASSRAVRASAFAALTTPRSTPPSSSTVRAFLACTMHERNPILGEACASELFHFRVESGGQDDDALFSRGSAHAARADWSAAQSDEQTTFRSKDGFVHTTRIHSSLLALIRGTRLSLEENQ
jgi:hypothetical protein